MTSQLKLTFNESYSCIRIIMIHIFLLNVQGKWMNKKRTKKLCNAQFGIQISYYSKTNYICNIIDIILTQNWKDWVQIWNLKFVTSYDDVNIMQSKYGPVLKFRWISDKLCAHFPKPPKVSASWNVGSRPDLGQLKTWRSPIFDYFYC